VSATGVYLDEDVQSQALIESLRAQRLAVLTTSEAGMSKATDEEQLKFATSRSLIFISCNVADFARLHNQWTVANLDHAGIILIQQQKWGPGELARRIVRVLNSVPGGNFSNRLEYISNW
jgi:hypothetical protein